MTATDTTTTPEKFTEHWTWAGRRLNHKDEVRAVWAGPDGTQRSYPAKYAGKVIGGTYSVTISRSADGATTLWGIPVFFEPPHVDDDPQFLDWAIQDGTCMARKRLKAMERAAAKQSPLDRALEPILDIAARMRTNADRDALAAYIIREIDRSWATR